MLKNVVKELTKAKEKQKDFALNNNVITEVNKLLEYDNHRDLEILRAIGPQSNLVQAEDKKGQAIELERKENFFAGTVFTRREIVSLATKYRLKFLRSDAYKSYIDPTVTIEIKELERSIAKSMERDQAKKRGVSVEDYRAEKGETTFKFDAYVLKNNFYILAPASCFHLQKVSKHVPDPVMFYTDDNIHFRLIKKWGKDFTIFRRLLGQLHKNRPSMFWTLSFIGLGIGVCLIPIIGWWTLFFLLSLPISGIITYTNDMVEEYWGASYVTSNRIF